MAYKQHFIEWFSGKGILDIWVGNGVSMANSIDGGLNINAGQIGFDTGSTHKGANFSHTGCKMISVMKINQTGDAFSMFHGMTREIYSNNGFYVALPNSNSYFKLGSYQGTSTGAETTSTKALDTDWHKFDLGTDGTTMTMVIDDVTETTRTSYHPADSMFPFSKHSASGNLRYLECYNT